MTPDDHTPDHEAHESLSAWATRITDTTGFTDEEIHQALSRLNDHGYSPEETAQLIGPIAAYANAWDHSLGQVVDCVAGVHALTDASAIDILDTLEELQTGEKEPNGPEVDR